MESVSPDVITARPDDVLVVEDDLLIALDLEETLARLGVKSVRTATHVAQALAMIADRAPALAFLNIDLGSENSIAVAGQLDSLGIPFAYVTGYGMDGMLPAKFENRPRLNKPFSTDAIVAVLQDPFGKRP